MAFYYTQIALLIIPIGVLLLNSWTVRYTVIVAIFLYNFLTDVVKK